MSNTPIFDTKTDDKGNHVIFHTATDTALRGGTFRPKSGEIAESSCDEANKFAKLSKSKLKKLIAGIDETDKGAETKKKVLGHIFELVHGTEDETPAAPQFLAKAKGRETYGSAARNSFAVQANVTAKEALILTAIEDITATGATPFSDKIADQIGVTPNVVAGAVSVMLSKALVESYREKDNEDKKIKRAYRILCTNWRELVGKADETAKAKRDERAAKNAATREEAKAKKDAEKEAKKAERAAAKEAEAAAKKEETTEG